MECSVWWMMMGNGWWPNTFLSNPKKKRKRRWETWSGCWRGRGGMRRSWTTGRIHIYPNFRFCPVWPPTRTPSSPSNWACSSSLWLSAICRYGRRYLWNDLSLSACRLRDVFLAVFFGRILPIHPISHTRSCSMFNVQCSHVQWSSVPESFGGDRSPVFGRRRREESMYLEQRTKVKG